MIDYTSPDGKFHVAAGPDDSVALARAMKAQRLEREADDAAYADRFWADWTDADEAQFQADMRRIDAKIAEERRVARALAGGIATLKGQRSSSSQSCDHLPSGLSALSIAPEIARVAERAEMGR